MTLSFAMVSQTFRIAIYSEEYEKVFPSLKQKKRKKKDWEDLSWVIIVMTVLLHLKICALFNSVGCLPLDSSLALINRNSSQSFSACLLNSLLSSWTSDKQCRIAFVKLQGFWLSHLAAKQLKPKLIDPLEKHR